MAEDERVVTNLRIPKPLHEQVKAAAAAEGLSVNQWANRALLAAAAPPAALLGVATAPHEPLVASSPTPHPRQTDSVSASECKHPAGRRIDKTCMVCGGAVGK